jgi:hypothetical protein
MGEPGEAVAPLSPDDPIEVTVPEGMVPEVQQDTTEGHQEEESARVLRAVSTLQWVLSPLAVFNQRTVYRQAPMARDPYVPFEAGMSRYACLTTRSLRASTFHRMKLQVHILDHLTRGVLLGQVITKRDAQPSGTEDQNYVVVQYPPDYMQRYMPKHPGRLMAVSWKYEDVLHENIFLPEAAVRLLWAGEQST